MILLHMYLLLGPCGKQLTGSVCPLGVDHPPTGEEFVIGCAMCINTRSFWNHCTKIVFNKMLFFFYTFLFLLVVFLNIQNILSSYLFSNYASCISAMSPVKQWLCWQNYFILILLSKINLIFGWTQNKQPEIYWFSQLIKISQYCRFF